MVTIPYIPNKNKSVIYLLESFDVRHGRLEHINFGTMKRLMNMKLLPKCEVHRLPMHYGMFIDLFLSI